MNKGKIFLISLALLCVLLIYAAYAFDLPKLFYFNKEDALKEWQEKIFKDKVMYTVELKGQVGELLAQSNKACSGLIYKLYLEPKNFPWISWNWKISKFPDKGPSSPTQPGWVEKDDYAARVYVIFSSWNFLSMQSLEYIWDESLPVETIKSSPFSKNIKLIVAESGKNQQGKWMTEERKIYEDYQKAFGRPPTRAVIAIALMTDSDNTLSTAEAVYTNIKVGYNK